MSARIRLQRKGRGKYPKYRVVVTDRGKGTQAGYIESLGNYFPIPDQENEEIDLNEDRALHWLQSGAQPSGSVRDLFNKCGLFEKLEERKKEASSR